MHCDFHNHPSLKEMVLVLWKNVHLEVSISDLDTSHDSVRPLETTNWKRLRDEAQGRLSKAITDLGNNASGLQSMLFNDALPVTPPDCKVAELVRGKKSETVVSALLLKLEHEIESRIDFWF